MADRSNDPGFVIDNNDDDDDEEEAIFKMFETTNDRFGIN